jgi:hypothetical protein
MLRLSQTLNVINYVHAPLKVVKWQRSDSRAKIQDPGLPILTTFGLDFDPLA